MAQKAVSPLDCVPDEIISSLLYFISPDDNLHGVQLVSRRFNRLANEPLLWRHHCCGAFKHWHPAHNFEDKIDRLACETNWKQLFLLRASRNRRIARLLDAIIETKVGRVKRFELICQLGYDAKDFLLEQCQTDPCADDGHYSNAILDSIHRSIAIEEWRSLQQAPDQHSTLITGVQLERALGSFDMFVLHDQPGDLDDITRMLDEYTARFRASHPTFDIATTRQKALKLVRWLRANNLTGVCNPERNYRNLRNCLIGQALRHEEHESIPIISSAIFCCMASRLGMDARCCAFPSHVHAIVYAAPGQTLDNLPVTQPDAPPQRMFLDPYGTDDEVPVSALHAMLARFGWLANVDAFLAPVSALSITMRTAQNLKATLARILELQDHAHPELSQLMHGDNVRNIEACLYSASWASLILTPLNDLGWIGRLERFLRRIAGSWPEDAWLIEKYLWPIYSSMVPRREGFPAQANQGLGDPWQYWRFIREQDGVVPRVIRRESTGNLTEPPFKIGQVFRHRRYGWIGVITSWSDREVRQPLLSGPGDMDGTGSRRSILLDGQPPHQARPINNFYFTCLPSTGPEPHVVAANNIRLVTDPNLVTYEMFPLAGKFFKRFDPATCSFVSNIKEQFPDD